MMFQIFATIVLACIALYAYSQVHLAPLLTRFTILGVLCGEYLVLFPAQTTVLAGAFGVGRGTDLLLYLWLLLSLIIVLNVHLRLRRLNDRLIELTRQLALRDASQQTSGLGE